ncbi:polysaccharide deacetylase family protein [Aquamicrobium sp. LC103]|uniref:polysaccharide deacetylase family protein n=1 Tax=Aquamicrobium sp. LC103 TaxID=1120658 RepID=UPI00069B08F2|nr:polysaccharide deacetylase family protein [Aquamicrobium sp. LC103]TKT77458.1 polysaccharide deacetylase family protein [Aquamicrobium sp. LC103]
MIRKFHLEFFQKHLPDDLAIYFHELEDWNMPRFEEAIAHLVREGYRTASPRAFAAGGRGKRLFISFDDNYQSWHRALPVLERHGVTCTFYVNSGVFRDMASPSAIHDYRDRIAYRGSDRTLSRAELREISAAGHTIGCHTHTHPMLSRLDRRHWDAEILHSKTYLEGLIGKQVRDFSFPYGMRRHFSPALRDYCEAVGFKTIASGISGLQHAPSRDPLSLHRTEWKLALPLEENLAHMRIHAPFYGNMMGRSVIGSGQWLAVPMVW